MHNGKSGQTPIPIYDPGLSMLSAAFVEPRIESRVVLTETLQDRIPGVNGVCDSATDCRRRSGRLGREIRDDFKCLDYCEYTVSQSDSVRFFP
mgnify:CR=1 FL=1